jgi:DNA-binding XRE family transcriptional regulator
VSSRRKNTPDFLAITPKEIRQVRLTNGLTIAELAHQTGYSTLSIIAQENGSAPESVKYIEKLKRLGLMR